MDAYIAALTLLSRRELSTRQLRDRLTKRGFTADEISETIARLTSDRTLDDRRVASASARMQVSIRGKGRRRVLQHVQQLGISEEIARVAVDDAFSECDETALLDRAIDRRLRGAAIRSLDAKARARLVRGVLAQGFDLAQVLARLRTRGADTDE